MIEKKKAEKQPKKVLAALDTAVQKWYEANAPENTERYASCHIRTYQDGSHVSSLTLRPDDDKDNYIDIVSSKEKRLNGSHKRR